ncbi:hypothetical protein CR513_15009, partial [Mucuna pruriens]
MTFPLHHHVETCKEIKFEDVCQMISHELCVALILKHDLPLKFVEYNELRSWIKYLNPYAIPIFRNTSKSDVLKIYMTVAFDLWLSCNTKVYIRLKVVSHAMDKIK